MIHDDQHITHVYTEINSGGSGATGGSEYTELRIFISYITTTGRR